MVSPNGKVSLDVWEQVTETIPSTLSVAFGIRVTLDEELNPKSVPDVTLRQFREGSSISEKISSGKYLTSFVSNCVCYLPELDPKSVPDVTLRQFREGSSISEKISSGNYLTSFVSNCVCYLWDKEKVIAIVAIILQLTSRFSTDFKIHLPMTETVKEQLSVFKELSVALQVTIVFP